MNPALSAIRFAPTLERVIASRFFVRYIIVAIVVFAAYMLMNKGKKGGE